MDQSNTNPLGPLPHWNLSLVGQPFWSVYSSLPYIVVVTKANHIVAAGTKLYHTEKILFPLLSVQIDVTHWVVVNRTLTLPQ